MRIPLDHQSEDPLYLQIAGFMRRAIQTGSLAPNTRLPSTRQLAADLNVNRITVENAYRELEADGLIYTRAGSGTYVLPQPPLTPLPVHEPGSEWPLWQQQLETWNESVIDLPHDAVIRPADRPDLIRFDTGVGDVRQFPADEFRKVLQAVMRRDGMNALDYGELQGYGPLRVTIAQVLASQGLLARPENVLITAGSQQALTLICRLLLNPGDVVLVESPTYAGALDLFRALSLRVVGLPVDRSGMQVDGLEQLLQKHHPRLIYTIPNFQNPTGVCLSLPRRRLLISLADRYNVPILEDDYVGDLRYEGRALPALKALDPGGRVIYASTFSKMLMPGLRVGFLAAEGPVLDSLINYKRVTDLSSSSLFQRALEAYVTVGRYHAHLRRSSQLYRKRRDAMLEAAVRYLPEAQVDPPQGGLFIWLRLPEAYPADRLLPLAAAEGVSFAPGRRFFPDGVGCRACLRLNFTAHPPERIDEGFRRLRRAVRRMEEEKRAVHQI